MASGKHSLDEMYVMGDYGLVKNASPENVILNDQPNKIVVEIHKGKCVSFQNLNLYHTVSVSNI